MHKSFFTTLLLPLLTGIFLLLSSTTAMALGPQPEPPDKYRKSTDLQKNKIKHKIRRRFTRPGGKRMINPQPEPPGKSGQPKSKGKHVAPGSTKGFNPQPEPPGMPGQPKGMQH